MAFSCLLKSILIFSIIFCYNKVGITRLSSLVFNINLNTIYSFNDTFHQFCLMDLKITEILNVFNNTYAK